MDAQAAVFEHPEFDHHAEVQFLCDPASGLRAVLAIHRTTRFAGGSGGCRMQPYPSSAAALTDALRLSRGMSYKLALAGVPIGGAKMVVMGAPAKDKSEALLRAIGRAVERVAGRYVTGGDVGIGGPDLDVIADETHYLVRTSEGGDASEATALGVLRGIERSVSRHLDGAALDGLTIGVQGLGHVGRRLCELLAERGARLVVADPRRDLTDAVAEAHGAEVVDPDALLSSDLDVLAPCALGAVLNPDTVPHLRCRIIAGAANNQLSTPDVADALAERGIAYAPDFVVNAGGALTSSQRARGEDLDIESLETIAKNLDAIFDRAESEAISTHEAAERIARARAPYLA
jgi:leucine dehydrogenase